MPVLAVLSALSAALTTRAAEADPAGVEFFESKIRPIFADHCYKCHSAGAEKVKGGLLLDSRDGLLKGGDTGSALVPGDPEKSLFIKAIRYTDEDLQMPPKGKKLSGEQIAALEAWVKMGAPDPRTKPVATAQAAKPDAEKHWAFQPIQEPSLPAVKDQDWVRTPVDLFILARLEAKGIGPSPRAEKRTLIRRATFDLTGLPPTPREVEEFLADDTSEAFAHLVDRLLASPHYGERWGRYWLDIARYADTKGYVFEEERRFPYSYTYRDYVIRAFNDDLPFDRFIIEQLAADLLPLGDDKRALAALGFLTLGRRFLNNQPDIIDDRIDVVTRGMMGLTVACARCHDHKYDPIPTKDYYSLYGVFASSKEPDEKPLLGSSALPKQHQEYLAEREKREKELEIFREEKEQEILTKLRTHAGDYLLAAHEAGKLEDQGKQDSFARERKLDPTVLQRWTKRLEEWRKGQHSVFAPWFALAEIPENEFVSRAAELSAKFSANTDTNAHLNPLVARIFADPPKSLKEVAQRYSELFAGVEKQWREKLKAQEKAVKDAAAPAGLDDPYQESLRQILYASESPVILDSGQLRRLFDTPAQQKLRALRRKVDELDATHPGAPPRAMALVDNDRPYDPHVFLRGNPNNPGPEVPRQFLKLLSGPDRKPFEKGSGRLELAQAIASTNNPLTARVIVNRVWMYHFAAPLVRTPSDFGMRSDPPTHPELLDYLAAHLMREGWSLKKLHRLLMLSSVYQQSSRNNPESARVDPSNDLLWRMNRRRLDFEAMRDSFLAVSGRIDFTEGGRSVDITDPGTVRRTVYGFVERQNLPGMFRTFDFASPDTTSARRFSTTVPQQALFLLNSPFIVEQAKAMLRRPELKNASEEERVRAIYQIAFQRQPQPEELKLALNFLDRDRNPPAPPEPSNWQYGFGEFDPAAQKTKTFQPLPHFTGSAWQGGDALPDAKLGWVLLKADGGHVGNDPQHAAIRRWIAPRDGLVNISGELRHADESGDGVRGRIISSRQGLLGEWVAHNQKAATDAQNVEVKRGDTIDFMTDCRESVSFDSFTWAPVIKYRTDKLNYAAGVKVEWKAQSEFTGPPDAPSKPLTTWEEYAQVLLLANEFVFVD